MKIFGTILPYIGFTTTKYFPGALPESIEELVKRYASEDGESYDTLVLVELDTFSIGWFDYYARFHYNLATYYKDTN